MTLRGLIVSAVLFLAAPAVARLFGETRAASLVRLIAVLPLLSSVASPRMADLIRELQFSRLAPIAIASVTLEIGLAILLAGKMGGIAIIIGKLAGATVTTVASYLVAPHTPRFRSSYASGQHLVAFGRWLFAIGVTAVSSDLLLKAIIARRLSVGDLGLFSMSDKLAETPTQIANESIGAVAFPLYVRLRSDAPRLQAAVRAHLTGLMFFLFPATAVIIALARPLEVRVLGPSWTGISLLIVLLTLGYAFEFGFNVLFFLLQALGAGARLFVVELSQYVTLITAIILLAGPFGLIGIGAARIITSIVLVIAGLIAAPEMYRATLAHVFRPAAILVVLATVAGITSRVCVSLVPGAAGVAVGVFAGAIVFLGLVWVTDQPLRTGVRECLSLFFPILGLNRAGYTPQIP
jgi:O-antigen/teichoic acid export membrane protein